MNKLKTLALATCLSFVASVASAEVRMGVSVHAMMLDSTGSETLRTSGNVTSTSIDETAIVPSVFIETMNSAGFGVGIDYVQWDDDTDGYIYFEESVGGNRAEVFYKKIEDALVEYDEADEYFQVGKFDERY